MSDEIKYPMIRLTGNGGGEFPMQATAFAYDGENRAMLISAVGASTSVKAFAAVLSDRKIPSRLTVKLPNRYGTQSYEKCDCGYDIERWRIQGPWWHMVAISKDPRFMPYYDDEALWQRLNSSQFTTPVLREWSDYILSNLKSTEVRLGHGYGSSKALAECKSFNCKSAMLYATDKHLDDIVSNGLKRKLIAIPE